MRETSIAAGSRRIFAVTGQEADKVDILSNKISTAVGILGDNVPRATILALREDILALPAVKQARLRSICKCNTL